MRTFFFFLPLLILLSCKEQSPGSKMNTVINDTVVSDSLRFRESYRPQYHFSPPTQWMNDPNGLVFNKGTYHLFYQYYPEDIVWGPMHWGHATSKDLVKWKHQPIALYPDSLGYIFSGSAVVDHTNTSGLGSKDNPPIVAIYTYHNMEGEKAGRSDFQTQGIAYSLDQGQSWKKYKNNPVIGNPDGIRDFRDPKVMWHEPSQRWIMTLVAGDHAKFYSAPDLIHWTHISDFGKDVGAHGGVWECPDLFRLQTADGQETKWVLLISINPGAPNGGSGTQYFIGDFDGTQFTTTQTAPKWLDYGSDNYAGVTYNGLPDQERRFIGWMSNWNYAQKTPTKNWRSAMTLARKLALVKLDQGFFLQQQPVDQLDAYLSKDPTIVKISDTVYRASAFNQHKITLDIKKSDGPFSLHFENEVNQKLTLGWQAKTATFFIDKTRSGLTQFEPRFADRVHTAPLPFDLDKDFKIELYIDASSIEVFVNGGLLTMTEQVFPTQPYTRMTIAGNVATSLPTFTKVARIWD